MTDLGELGGTPTEPVDVQFTYFGEHVRAHPELGELVLIEFLHEAATIEADTPQGMTATKDFIAKLIHPEDFDRFWTAAVANRQTVDALMAMAEKLISAAAEQATDRPTTRPVDSSAGPLTIVANSEEDSFSEVVRRKENEGRPDLALAILQARERSVG